jgi:prevent-host-death family protein
MSYARRGGSMGLSIDSKRLVKVSEFREDAARWLDEAETGPVFILRHGTPKAVLIGMQAFEELLARATLRGELDSRERESVTKTPLDDV